MCGFSRTNLILTRVGFFRRVRKREEGGQQTRGCKVRRGGIHRSLMENKSGRVKGSAIKLLIWDIRSEQRNWWVVELGFELICLIPKSTLLTVTLLSDFSTPGLYHSLCWGNLCTDLIFPRLKDTICPHVLKNNFYRRCFYFHEIGTYKTKSWCDFSSQQIGYKGKNYSLVSQHIPLCHIFPTPKKNMLLLGTKQIPH